MSGSKVINMILEREGLKAGTFAKVIGITTAQVYDLQKGKVQKVSPKVAQKILKIYPFYSYSWLLTGEGDMLLNTTRTEKTEEIFSTDEYRLLQQKFNALLNDYNGLKNQAEPLNPNAVLYVPLVNQYAHAGYLNGYQNNTYMENLPTIPFYPDTDTTGEHYVAFEVRGDSMDDGTKEALSDGDILICRELPFHIWKDSPLPINRWDFVIVHEEGIIVKRIINHDLANHTITIHSLNDFYTDKIINLANVKQIFCIVESRAKRRR